MDELKRRIILMLNMRRGDMVPWYTGKPCAQADRSHINFCVADSTWEAKAAYDLDHTPAGIPAPIL
jgi:hypothetical protein